MNNNRLTHRTFPINNPINNSMNASMNAATHSLMNLRRNQVPHHPWNISNGFRLNTSYPYPYPIQPISYRPSYPSVYSPYPYPQSTLATPISISSDYGVTKILIAILLLACLDLIFVRPTKIQQSNRFHEITSPEILLQEQ